MDFLNMDFSTLFLEKHGRDIFYSISEQINREKQNKCSKSYVEIVFKFALLEFWGLNDFEIKRIIEDIMPGQEINTGEIKSIHKESMAKIEKYLQSEIGDFNE